MSMPPSSPRLPSPPPPTEIQIGPKSASLNSSSSQESPIEQSAIEENSLRRIHPGTKSSDMAAGPPLVPLNELDSAFQLQEHLKALHYYHTKHVNSDNTTPITRETALLIAAQPEGIDRALWLYELCRFLINKCNDLIIGFLFDDPPCSASTCPEMRASEWQFLCAVHESPKSCCAIDYCCHTLDWATNIVTSQKIFPSRLSLGAGDAVDQRGAGERHLTNIFRRLHRIFAHAWFQHRGVFWQVEGQTGLYVLFKIVCDTYNLLPPEHYKLPPEAEGLEPVEEPKGLAPSLLKSDASPAKPSMEEDLNVNRNNTRRHIRQSPSLGSAVTTVLESDEEEPDVTNKLEGLRIEEDEEVAEIPVVVETYENDEKTNERVTVQPDIGSFQSGETDEPKLEAEIASSTAPPESKDTGIVEKKSELEVETDQKENEKETKDEVETLAPELPELPELPESSTSDAPAKDEVAKQTATEKTEENL